MSSSPVRVAIVNDYEIVVRGLASVLAPHESRVVVVEIDSRLPVVNTVDVVLYDTFGQVQGDAVELSELTIGSDARVAIFTWNLQAALVQGALERGVSGYLSKSLSAEQLVDSIEAIHRGIVVVPAHAGGDDDALVKAWPGREHKLSAREAEVVALITQGLSNQEIADRCYLSINSVKTYVRTAYRKMGVSSRSRAVLWGIDNGFLPDRSRAMDPNG
ncbi:DNA-binding response regulator [Nocardioides psychrotolerans]|uniref:DNA-binding response regulator, NarL/FixJ family, contains REC and HTH domains n=1 Tax=Nocardioides psychrotolerans TaxID=1005945 RepID=A0A1I3DR63_9ACTN|nr:response regulator transcription factor [Nocardioides psychrotolerans]GEP40570.1 DNA-binding response regulator [Nocardioides psychrotolerans]SFH88991.1 DNA-binding response regulator, NarL/FixJ family, contains REC and HTH domains [Nocardioides psychrotolerans]